MNVELKRLTFFMIAKILSLKSQFNSSAFTFLTKQGDKESIHRHNTCDMGQSSGIRTLP